jgi:hypothetical protein
MDGVGKGIAEVRGVGSDVCVGAETDAALGIGVPKGEGVRIDIAVGASIVARNDANSPA